MFKLLVTIFLVVLVYDVEGGISNENVEKGSARQKKLLFYDEEGNLVKTYKNPYEYDFAGKFPFFSPFSSLFRPNTFGGSMAYMIPVSDQVIQKINSDPSYQNRLFTLPRKEMIIEPNTQCSGKRTQIPAKSCRKFLNCWDGWAFEQECPEGLVFSREGYCDYPHNVDCSQRDESPSIQPIPAQSSPPIPPQSSPAIPSQPAPAIPAQPAPAIPAQPAPAIPAQPSQPSPAIPAQPSPAIPAQPSPAEPAQPPAAPTPSPPGSFCSKDFESFRNEYKCNEFFVCVDRVPIRFQCPADLVYNQEYGVCDYAYNVDCKNSMSTVTEASQPKPCAANEPLPKSPAVGDPNRIIPGFLSTNTILDKQSWSSMHVAVSRQDAIRQLQLGANA